jgi:glycosyltransferase involved in cell wall biosynthesis
MHIAIITAGGAGMFCGSCMHDNTWAKSLQTAGAEVTLIPTYTPVRVDEENLSVERVFLGGINVYMDARWPRLWGKLPRFLTRWLDAPGLLNLTRFASNDARNLGPLTVAMLKGDAGPDRREFAELVDFLASQLKPDVICFSNALLAGAVRTLRQQFDGRIYCILQGDDIFLKDLPEPYQSQAIAAIRARADDFDGFLVHSDYYRDFMSGYLGLPAEKFHKLPLGIDLTGHDGQPVSQKHELFTVGYFARICEEKGLHQLVDAFRILKRRHTNVRLLAGGFLGKRDDAYFRRLTRDARDLGDAYQYVGSPQTHDEKVALLKQFDVLSVPTVYHEPKGLYVLEALANGIPVVQPRHGAFPELLESTGGGLLVEPGNAEELAEALESLMQNTERRIELATTGRANVHSAYNEQSMADATLQLFAASLGETGSA